MTSHLCQSVPSNVLHSKTAAYIRCFGIRFLLTHWGRVTHICVSKLTIIGSDNGLSPGRRQAITWTNIGILLIGTLGTNFSEMLIEIHTFSFKKIHLKMSSGKWRPFCLGLNELNENCLVHHVHWYGFSSAWMRRCFARFPLFENCLMHLYGFSPMWMRICSVSCTLYVNCLMHKVHLYGFSPVSIRSVKCPSLKNCWAPIQYKDAILPV